MTWNSQKSHIFHPLLPISEQDGGIKSPFECMIMYNKCKTKINVNVTCQKTPRPATCLQARNELSSQSLVVVCPQTFRELKLLLYTCGQEYTVDHKIFPSRKDFACSQQLCSRWHFKEQFVRVNVPRKPAQPYDWVFPKRPQRYLEKVHGSEHLGCEHIIFSLGFYQESLSCACYGWGAAHFSQDDKQSYLSRVEPCLTKCEKWHKLLASTVLQHLSRIIFYILFYLFICFYFLNHLCILTSADNNNKIW